MYVNYYKNQHAFTTSSIEEVFEKFYPVTELRPVYRDILLPSQGKTAPDKCCNKSIIVKALLAMLKSPEEVEHFIAAMSPSLRKVLETLIWLGDIQLLKLEEDIGFDISDERMLGTRYYYYGANNTEISRKEEFSLVVFKQMEQHNDRYKPNEISTKERISVQLPPALRSCLRKLLLPPRGYDPEPVVELPDGLMTYRCDDALAEDLRVVADYIAHGHLQYTKAEKIKKPCIRALTELTQGGEFFPGDKTSKKLPLLRHELLTNMVASVGQGIRGAMLAEPLNPARVLRAFLAEIIKRSEWIHEYVLTHISSFKYHCEYNKTVMPQLRDIFALLPDDGWITFSSLVKCINYRDINLELFTQHRCQVSIDPDSTYYNRHTRINLGYETHHDFLAIPLIQGMAFLFAALGFTEIAYTKPPNHPRWKRNAELFLTPYDGLAAVRLTPLGAYALEKTNEVVLKTISRKRAEIILNPQRLTVTCRNMDRVTELSLLEFMEKISPWCYRMTRKSFMRGCSTDREVKIRIDQFKSNISTKPPPFWQNFLDNLEHSSTALREKSFYKVFELSDTPELRRLFSTDPELRKHILKVEGLKIVIKETDQPAISRRLATFGYLMQ